MRSRAYSETNVPRPTKTIDRHTTAPDSRRNDDQSSRPAPSAAAGAGAVRPAAERTAAVHSATPARAGRPSRGEARSPPVATTAATSGGANAKPTFPPSANQPIAV